MKKLTMTLAAFAACTPAPDSLVTPQQPNAIRVDRIEHADDGVPYFAVGALGRVRTQVTSVAEATALDGVMPAIAKTFRVPAQDLVATKVINDELGMTHVKYQQRTNGLRVVGGELVVHLAKNGDVSSVNSTARDLSALPTVAKLDAAAADRAAIADTNAGKAVAKRAPQLVFVLTEENTGHLAWETEVWATEGLQRDRVYVDALGGHVIERHPMVYTAKNRTILDGLGQEYNLPIGTQIGTEGSPPTDPAGKGAYDGTGITYDCYKTLYNRDSYDNAGAGLESKVHVTFGGSGNNAAWTGTQMVYGDGDGVTFSNLANAVDVTAHELTHAVTESTSGLVYQNESGALNEAMSDIMAAVCEAHNDGAVSAGTWLIGEDVYTPGTAGDALRYMSSPTRDQYSKDYYPEKLPDNGSDNGGVHGNSGIANLAFYLLTNGGKHPRNKTTYMVPAIGIANAGLIFNSTNTKGYFTMGTTFAMARTVMKNAAKMEVPGSEIAVETAWAAVGVGGPPPVDNVLPTVSITAPTDGATVEAGFAVDVTAADDAGVARVELSVDGAAAGSDTEAPYSFTTDPALASGSHTVTATAFDFANNMATAAVTVMISGEEQTPDGGEPDGGDPTNPDDGDGGGCCSTGGDPMGAVLLFGMTALVLRRRRRG